MKYPFYTAITTIKDLYDIELSKDDFESLAFNAWNRIGNKDMMRYRYVTNIEDCKVDLPCNADAVESVHYFINDFNMPENVSREDYSFLTLETYVESRKTQPSLLYESGKLIRYEQINNSLSFKITGIPVKIIYKGIVADEEGLPYLSLKEVNAISAFCAFIHTRKKGMVTKDTFLVQMADKYEQEWKRLCDHARVFDRLSQNDMNDILDVQYSWDRKRFGKSFKFM